ncbi:MAG: hypothetical protein ACOC2P_02345 [Spirochaetota bacterium]
MRIGIVGHGALGTLYGQAFTTAPESQVIYISNRERAERLRRRHRHTEHGPPVPENSRPNTDREFQ